TGVQLGMSTRFEDPDNPAFTASPAAYSLNIFDRDLAAPVGNVKRRRVGLAAIQELNYADVDQGPDKPSLTRFHLVADTARRLDVGIDTKFGSKFSKSRDTKAAITVQDVPARWDLTTDMDKTVDHKGSSRVGAIDVDILQDDSNDRVSN